jgi:ATP phosphoribosyltransferase regulatory subunit
MRRLVSSRNSADLERFLAEHAYVPDECREIARLAQLAGKGEAVEKAQPVINNARSRAGLDRLSRLWRMIEALNLADHFEIDLGDVAKLDYYTGLTFNIYVTGAPARVGSGGRYDGLTAAFGKPEPAVGFVLDLDALTSVLLARNSNSSPPSDLERRNIYIPDCDSSLMFADAIGKRAQGERVQIKYER